MLLNSQIWRQTDAVEPIALPSRSWPSSSLLAPISLSGPSSSAEAGYEAKGIQLPFAMDSFQQRQLSQAGLSTSVPAWGGAGAGTASPKDGEGRDPVPWSRAPPPLGSRGGTCFSGGWTCLTSRRCPEFPLPTALVLEEGWLVRTPLTFWPKQEDI